MNMKKITSMTMFWSLIILIINSVVLYVVPEGRVAHWAVWRFIGLTKEDWSAQHTTVGFLFLFAGLLHIYYNWKPIIAYMKDKARRVRIFTGSSSVGLALTIFFVIGTYFNVVPMSTIMELSEHFKSTATAKYGDPPYGQAQSSSLQMFTGRVGLDLAKSIELLEAAGISVSDGKETLSDIAKRHRKTPQQIYEIIRAATVKPVQTSTEHNTDPSISLTPAKSGMGKKTISQMCSEIGVDDCSQIIAKLEAKGIKVEASDKVKDAATANRIDPMQIYETMAEIVSEKRVQ